MQFWGGFHYLSCTGCDPCFSHYDPEGMVFGALVFFLAPLIFYLGRGTDGPNGYGDSPVF